LETFNCGQAKEGNKETVSDEIQKIEAALVAGDRQRALELAAVAFQTAGDAHRLFEIRKMQARLRLGLPLVSWAERRKVEGTSSSEEVRPEVQKQLEDQLLAACREAAAMLLANGNIAAAWPYLEPLDDRDWVRQQIERAPVDASNLEAMTEYAFHRGGHPAYGYRLILKNSGTCNAITLFDSAAPYLDRATRVKLAQELVEHFFAELVNNVGASMRDRQPHNPLSQTFGADELIRALSKGNLELSGGPHIDATHLNSVTRIGQIVSEPSLVEKLLTLSQYGSRLPEMFHFPGIAPFENQFADSVVFYQALAGREIGSAIEHFKRKLVEAEGTPNHLLVVETLVEWLGRIGRAKEAVEVAIAYPLDDFGQLGIAPNLLEIAKQNPEAEQRLALHFRERGDLLSFLMTSVSN
jgi:hypothetical protein